MGVGAVVTANLIADRNMDLFVCLALSGARRRRHRAGGRAAGAAGVRPVPGRHHARLRRGDGAVLPQPGELRAVAPAVGLPASRAVGRARPVERALAVRAGAAPCWRAASTSSATSRGRVPAGRSRPRGTTSAARPPPASTPPRPGWPPSSSRACWPAWPGGLHAVALRRHRAVDLPGVDEPARVLDGRHRRRLVDRGHPGRRRPRPVGRLRVPEGAAAAHRRRPPRHPAGHPRWPRPGVRDVARPLRPRGGPPPRAGRARRGRDRRATGRPGPPRHPSRRGGRRADGGQRAPRAAGHQPARRARASRRPTARSRCCSASTSASSATSCWRCSAPTAPASRPCSSRSPACCLAGKGRITFDGRDITRPAGRGDRPAGPVADARRQGRVPHAHGGREPAARLLDAASRPRRRPPGARRGHRHVPHPRGTPRPARRRPVGRRAAAAVAGDGVRHPPEAALHRRALARPRPDRRRPARRQGPRDPRPGHDRRRGRAVGERGPPAVPPGRVPREGPGAVPGTRRPACSTGPTSCGPCSSAPTTVSPGRASRPRRSPCRRRGSGPRAA